MLGTIAKWVDLRGRERWPTLWRVMLFWSPLICLASTWAFNEFHSLQDYATDYGISLVIATASILVCFTAGHAVHWAETAILTARGVAIPEHGPGWHLLVSAAALPLGVYLGFLIAAPIFGFEPPGTRGLIYGVVLGLIVMMAFFLYETLGDLRNAKRLVQLRSKEAENERLRGQIAALTAQMNPHLLFNALNTIASLTQSDPSAAEDTTVQLAELYRGVLQAARKERHSLAEELAICKAYLGIEQARFGERLACAMHTQGVDPEAVDIPPLCLQPLVENAVKHGIGPRAEGGRVDIAIEAFESGFVLRVTDDGVGFGRGAKSVHESVGLKNLRTRLALCYGEAAQLHIGEGETAGTVAEIVIPRSPAP